MFIEKVVIDNKLYYLYNITIFKETPMERKVGVASERLNNVIEHKISTGDYYSVREIDEKYDYVVPSSEEFDSAGIPDEKSIVESIEDAIRFDGYF